jgi:hypothetical protein
MGIFSKLVKPSNKPIEKRSIKELIDSVKHVNPMNVGTIIKSVDEKNDRHWLNPNDQTCFNFGWFTHQDFIDWANGTGVIVKGKTQEEKDKFMKYAKAYQELDISIFIYEEYLDLLNTKEIIHAKSSYRSDYVKDFRKSTELEKITDLLSNKAREIKSTLENRISYRKLTQPELVDISDIVKTTRDEYSKLSQEMCWTLGALGIGYYGACNTPCKIENLAWSQDLPFAVAYKEVLEESGYDLPDFKWVMEHRYDHQKTK